MTGPRLTPPMLAGPRATTALLALVNENLILRLKLAERDPALASLRGLDPAEFALCPIMESPRND